MNSGNSVLFIIHIAMNSTIFYQLRVLPLSISSKEILNEFSDKNVKFFSKSPRTSRIIAHNMSERKENLGSTSSAKDVLTGMVSKQVEDLLSREENRPLLEELEQASQRVEIAKKELAEIERQEMEALRLKNYVRELESRESEIAECQREILEARATVEEAEHSLTFNIIESSLKNEIDKDAERLESIKAGLVSSLIGTLAALPISLQTNGRQLVLQLAIFFVSCALFGVTFRYTIRRDLDNIHLKSGIAGAFGFVKGLAELEASDPHKFESGSVVSYLLAGVVPISENFFIFLFSSIALDYCFKTSLISPFPIRKSIQ